MDTVFNARLLTYISKETIKEYIIYLGTWCWIINKCVTGYLFNEIKKTHKLYIYLLHSVVIIYYGEFCG